MPNNSIEAEGYLDNEIPNKSTSSIIQSTDLAEHKDISTETTLLNYNYKKNGTITVRLSNLTRGTITIPQKAIICEVQPVTIEIQSTPNSDEYIKLLEEVDITKSDLNKEQLDIGKDLILQYKDIFSKGDHDLGHTDKVRHRIDMVDETSVKHRYRRIPPSMYDEVRSHLKQLLDNSVIRPSHLPFASAIVIVRKKNGTIRMCVDYRQLNKQSKKDSYALPRIEELLDCCAGSKFFSVLDMKSGYHQVEILEQHKERTAFSVGPLGFFEFNRMPFGPTNTPATYQRLMENCLSDYNLKICCIFIDDIRVFGKRYEEHLRNLQLIFQRIREANLKLSLNKCDFFKRKVKYVGHVVSEKGIEIDQGKTDKVVNWPTPTTPRT